MCYLTNNTLTGELRVYYEQFGENDCVMMGRHIILQRKIQNIR